MGSLIADKIITIGRFKSAIVANILIIISIIPMMWVNEIGIIIGRLILGFGSGVLIVVSSVYMAETVPS